MRTALTVSVFVLLAAIGALMPSWDASRVIVFAAVCVFFLTVLAAFWFLDHATIAARIGAGVLGLVLSLGVAYALAQGPSAASGSLLLGCAIGAIPSLVYAISGRPRILEPRPGDEWDTDDPWDGELDEDVLNDDPDDPVRS